MSKIFVDFEMTGLSMKDDPISIGVCNENGDVFYAEFNDYDQFWCSDWVNDNVIDNLLFNHRDDTVFEFKENDVYMKNDKVTIASQLLLWMDLHCKEPVTFIGDVCYYDFCHFLELFGGAFGTAFGINVNEVVHPVAYDINYDIADHNSISIQEAFDVNREEFLQALIGEEKFNILFDEVQKHNALHDAKVIKAIYDALYDTKL